MKGTKNLRPWKKGQSGNPSGLSKPSRLLTEALEGDWQLVHRKLRALLDSEDEKIVCEVVRFYVDHIKGKAKQAITDADGNSVPIGLVILPAREEA